MALDASRPAAWAAVYQQAQRWLAAGCFEPWSRICGRAAFGRGRKARAQRGDPRQPDLRSSPESGERAGYDGAKRKKGSKLHLAVDTLGHLLALHVTPANADDRAEVGRLAKAVRRPPARASSWPMSTRAITARSRPKPLASMASSWRS